MSTYREVGRREESSNDYFWWILTIHFLYDARGDDTVEHGGGKRIIAAELGGSFNFQTHQPPAGLLELKKLIEKLYPFGDSMRLEIEKDYSPPEKWI